MLFWAAVAVLATAPAWIVKHPPLQDMPFHMATLRVVHDYSNPTYHFTDTYVVDLLHTNYVLYYVVGSLLAFVLGVKYANVAMLCLYLGGTPLAIRELLVALGKDGRLAIFSIPLLVNAMFMLGLLPYVLGFPIMFWALAAAVRWIEAPTRARGILLGVLAFCLFFAHVLPFALFGIGFAAIFPWQRPHTWIKAAVPVMPSLGLVAWWITGSQAGKSSFGALGAGQQAVLPYDQALGGVFSWSINVFRDTTDELYFVLTVLVAAVAYGLSQGDKDRAKPISRGYVLLPIACVILYFTTGDSLGEVWLFSQRFPVPAMLATVPLLRMPTGARGVVATVAALALAVGSTVNTCKHFIKFELEEVGDIDGAIEQMDPGKRVAGLIYDKGSNIVNTIPFLHYVSYYQAARGGVVQFCYAHFRHWPFRYKEGQIPPPGRPPIPRWEWMPEAVPITELYPYYDYVLTRGGGFRPPAGTFHVKWKSDRWTVWARD